MNRWQDSLKMGIDLIPALVFIGLNSMLRGILAPELKKTGKDTDRLGLGILPAGESPESRGGIPAPNSKAVASVVS